MLAKFNVLLDYKKSIALLYPTNESPSIYNVNSWVRFPFHDKLVSTFKYHDNKVTLRWDTGAVPSNLSINKAKLMPLKKCPGIFYKSTCAYTSANTLTPFTNNTFPPMWFKLSNIPEITGFDGLVGANFYATHLVYFDFAHKNIYIKY